EKWMEPDAALPEGQHARDDERQDLMRREREETVEKGYPEFEVRAELPTHRDAIALAHRLRDEGVPVVHRWRYLLVGVTDEDSGKEMVDRIRQESPVRAVVKVEGTIMAVRGGPSSPFVLWRAKGSSAVGAAGER